MTISKGLRELREKAELSQLALANKAEVSAAFVHKLEAGQYSTLSIDIAHRLAKGLSMTFRDFLEAVGLLDDSSTPNTDAALGSALRARKLNHNQVEQVVTFVGWLERGGK